METRPPAAWQHYFRTPDATIYGPVDRATLCLWATDARVIPGCELSADKNHWFPVESLPELRLNWSVHFHDDTTYGPLNLLAIWTLAAEKSIPRGVLLVETGSRRTAVLDDSLLPLLMDECRKVLAGCGNTLSDAIGSIGAAHKASLAEQADWEASREELQARMEQAELDRATACAALAERDAQLSAMTLKLGATEGDLAVHLKLVSETQKRMAETLESGREQALKDSESLSQMKSEVESLSRSLLEARAEIQARDARITHQESAFVQLKSEGEAQAAELKTEAERLTQRLREVEAERQEKENNERKQESTLAGLKAEVENLASQLRAKNTAVDKSTLASRQREDAMAKQLSQAKEALTGAQKAGRQAEQKLKDEMASVQRDLNALMRASRCVKQVVLSENVKPASIDWVGEGKDSRAFPQNGDDDEVQFDRLTQSEKFVALQKELQSSAAEKEALRLDLENIRGRYGYLQTESSRKENESSEKLAQIQKEIKTSSELLTRSMEELERRERQLRESRKTGRAAPVDSAPLPVVLDAEVIHLEVLGPEEGGEHGGGMKEPVVGTVYPAAEPPQGDGVLNNVEAQLQRELKKWEASKRDKEHKGGTLGKWFRRK